MRFFSYEPEGFGFETHDTAEEAKSAAEKALDQEAYDCDAYDEDRVRAICWGEIREEVQILNRRDVTDEEKREHPEWSFYGEPRLQPVESARPLEDWHEDDGPVLWWTFPIEEAPWVGTPLDSDWQIGGSGPGGAYYTHWTRLPQAPAIATER